MTAQPKFSAQQKADYAFRRRYAQHKIWIALTNGDTKTFYAKDCNATVLQMGCGHVKHIIQSQEQGLKDCLAKEKFFRKRYRTAEVYRRLPDGTWSKHPIMKFISGQLVEETTEPLPADLKWQVVINEVGWELKPLVSTPLTPQQPTPPPVFIKPSTGKRISTDATSAGAIARKAYGFN